MEKTHKASLESRNVFELPTFLKVQKKKGFSKKNQIQKKKIKGFAKAFLKKVRR